ncbi:MAG: sce7726 family protein [Arcobacter sp.]|uniref:sce7726 family protein n=1 Tax=Arcobacter sp. TaxID=1872629 RepID=UPI003C7584A0
MNIKTKILNDYDIRYDLKSFLSQKHPRPIKIIEELRIHNGNAIADIVTIHNTMHCYEIKGDNDSIIRAKQQAEYYNTSFPKITLVTTEKHYKNALKKVPDFWGIILCKDNGNKTKFKYIRKSKLNPILDKRLALLSLWKSELEELAKNLNINNLKKSSNRDIFATRIAEDITLNTLKNNMSQIISKRETKNDWSYK